MWLNKISEIDSLLTGFVHFIWLRERFICAAISLIGNILHKNPNFQILSHCDLCLKSQGRGDGGMRVERVDEAVRTETRRK